MVNGKQLFVDEVLIAASRLKATGANVHWVNNVCSVYRLAVAYQENSTYYSYALQCEASLRTFVARRGKAWA